jgi:ribosomal protein S18 acetylase RimI-like enzyme
VLGVLKELQGRGLGKRLLKKANDMLVKKDKKFLTVKTLGDSHSDVHYKQTREFYKAVGFYPLEELLELWEEENPCLYMVKPL